MMSPRGMGRTNVAPRILSEFCAPRARLPSDAWPGTAVVNKPLSRRGFTLIEVMVVVIIVAIASAVAIPSFVKSFRGAKLKVGARTITMASRLARSTAVLQNQHMALLFFPEASEVEMVHVEAPSGRGEQSKFLNERDDRRVQGMLGDDEQAEAPDPAVAPTISQTLARRLPEGIRISDIEIQNEDGKFDGAAWVNFYPNGMSDKYTVTLIDEDNKEVEVSVDPISGKVSIEYLAQ